MLWSYFSPSGENVSGNVRGRCARQKGVLRFSLLLTPIVGSLLVSVLNFFNPEYIETGYKKFLPEESEGRGVENTKPNQAANAKTPAPSPTKEPSLTEVVVETLKNGFTRDHLEEEDI